MFSCQEDEEPFISINQTEFTVSDVGGAKTISIESNTSWTAKSSANWCTITPSSGDASTKTITAKLATNDTYAARSCNIIITAGSISKTLTFNQESNLGLLITQDKYDLSNDAATIELEVKANVEFDIAISGDWISQATTRSLSTSKLSFDIAKNESYDNREGAITIKQKNGTLTSTIKVFQSQEDAIIISEKTEELSSENQILKVELKTNVDFEVIIPDDAKSWVSYTTTRALRTEMLLLNISENVSDESRTAEIFIKNKATTLQDTLTIHQRALNVFIVDKMGALVTILNQTQKDTITIMKLKGELNKDDFDVMKKQMPKLKHLDLSEVKCEDNRIPDEAFGAQYVYSNQNIQSIILPISITTIGKYAFSKCYKLGGTLELPVGLTMIEEYAFSNTGFSGPLTLPAGLTSIGKSAFVSNNFTGSLTLPDGLKTVADDTFKLCSKFNGSLILPEGLTSIGSNAFYECKFTGSLDLPSGLTTIGEFAFEHCYGFTGTLNLPDGLTSIGAGAFTNCHNFISLILPSGLTTIKFQTFSACSGFTGSLILPDGLTMIESNAFSDCSGFTKLELGNSLNTIYNGAFIRCSNISGVVVFPNSISYIRNDAFRDCPKVDAFRFPHTTPSPYSNFENGVPDNATIQVPLSAVTLYQAANGWKKYNIVGY